MFDNQTFMLTLVRLSNTLGAFRFGPAESLGGCDEDAAALGRGPGSTPKHLKSRSWTRDWAERECTSFDQAVRKAAGVPSTGGGSIWDMPTIDSKRVASLLVELEPVLGCRLPSALIKRGGYENAEDLLADMLPKIRERCSVSPTLTANAQNQETPRAEGVAGGSPATR